MSHIENINVKVSDIDALATAVARFAAAGARFNEGCASFISYTGSNPCSHSITVEGVHYGVGVVKHGDGYDLSFDPFGASWNSQHDGDKLTETFGPKLGRLVDAYSSEYLQKQARQQGYSATETVAEDGSLIVTVNTY